MYPRTVVMNLPRIASDHSPIILNSDGLMTTERKGKRPMRLEPNWVRNDICKDIIKNHWVSTGGSDFLNNYNKVITEIKNWGIQNLVICIIRLTKQKGT